MKNSIENVIPYTTRDGSEIRELLHPVMQNDLRNQSLAEARVASTSTTVLHRHALSEEIYHILDGEGLMTLGNNVFSVQSGDSIVIAPGTPHRIHNSGSKTLRFLCCCSPAYCHDDTQLLE